MWHRARLQAVLAQQSGPVFVCGIARNIDQVLDLFGRLVVLRIDADTQEERLRAYDLGHPPGRNEAGRQQLREGRPIFEAEMLAPGAIVLDGTTATGAVADQLLALVSSDS